MTTSSVPRTDVSARPWLAADAARWRTAARPGWARPGLPVLVMIAAIVPLLMSSPSRACTPAAPCGTGWPGEIALAVLAAHLLFLLLLPDPAFVTGLLLLAYLAVDGQWQVGTGHRILDSFLAAGLCWSLAGSAARLRARARQRHLIREAAGGITAVAPRTAAIHGRQHRGAVRCLLGGLLLASGGGLVLSVVLADRADERVVRHDSLVAAPVLARNDENGTLTVRLPDGSRHRFDRLGKERFGRTAPVLVDGSSARLAAEPHGDRVTRRLQGLGLAALGVVLLASGLSSWFRLSGLRRRPVPVLRVQVRRRGGQSQILAHDDPAAPLPLLYFESFPEPGRAPREALLYGAPTEGCELVLAGTATGALWQVEATAGRVRLSRVDSEPDDDEDAEDAPPEADAAAEAKTAAKAAARGDRMKAFDAYRRKRRAEAEQRSLRALSVMAPVTGPVRWKAPAPDRAAAAVVGVLVLGVYTALVARWWGQGGFLEWHRDGIWLLGFYWLAGHVQIITWRVTADPAGLHIRSWLRLRHIPWPEATGAIHSDNRFSFFYEPVGDPAPAGAGAPASRAEGAAAHEAAATPAPDPEGTSAAAGDADQSDQSDDDDDDYHVDIGRVGIPAPFDRLLRRPAYGEQAAAQISAMIKDPALRPGAG